MQAEPPDANKKVGLWMGKGARRGPSQLGGRNRSSQGNKSHRRHNNNDYDEDDIDGDWDKEDNSSSLSEFVHPRHLMVESQKPKSNNSSASASSRQSRGALRKAARRMRPKQAEPTTQKASQNNLSELLEMPNWEHPSPFHPNQKRTTSRGDVSKGSKGRLGQLLDRDDEEDDSDEEGRGTSYLQQKIQGGKKASGKSCTSSKSRNRSKKGSVASASSLASKSIALHLEEENDTDDDSTGVELFQGGRKSANSDDDGSISSASVECFKPKPSKQEMAKSLLRSFDQELRMEAEKTRHGHGHERQQQRASHVKTEVDHKPHPKPHTSDRPPVPKSALRDEREREIYIAAPRIRQTVIPRDFEDDDDDDDDDNPIETFTAPKQEPTKKLDDREKPSQIPSSPRRETVRSNPDFRPQSKTNSRNAFTGASMNSISVSPAKSHSSAGGGNDPFNSSLKFEDLELNGSIDFGDIEPFVAPTPGAAAADDDNSIVSSGSIVSVDMLSDKEKEDLEEKMIRLAMERSLSDSGSMLDDVVSFTASQGHSSSGNFAVIDIEDVPDEVDGMAAFELEKEILDLAIHKSLNDSKTSEVTSSTIPITSEWSGSSASGSTAPSHPSERQRRSTGKVLLSSTIGGGGTSATSSRKQSGEPSRPASNGSVASHYSHGREETTDWNGGTGHPRVCSRVARDDAHPAPRRIMRPRPAASRSACNGGDPSEKTIPRRPSRGSRPLQDI